MRLAVRAKLSEASAELMRPGHPNRLRFEMFADQNPFMRPVADWAESVRRNRRPASPDNPFLAYERMVSDMITGGLEMWGKARDAATGVLLQYLRLSASAGDGRSTRRRNLGEPSHRARCRPRAIIRFSSVLITYTATRLVGALMRV